jgi:multidrug efflux pump subunit AcrA (membrane-fusion protein)
MKNKIRIAMIIGIVIIVAGLGFLIKRKYFFDEYLKPKTGDIIESIYGLGTVSADYVFRLRTAIPLNLKKVFVKEGDLVHPQDPLIQLDDNIMKTAIEGTVTSVTYKIGELVTPQVPIVTVTNLNHLYLEVSLEQQSILRIKNNQSVLVSFESLREEKLDGIVKSIYPRDNQFIIRIELSKWPAGVLPGMTADVAILIGKKTNALLIPIKSIVAGKVTRIRQGKKEQVSVKLGIIDGEWGEVISDNIKAEDELQSRK